MGPPTRQMPPIAADHKPYSITIEQAGAPSATLRDVLFGEVWVCSGQSNMAFLVENAFGGADLVQDANNHPEIRLFTTRKLTAGSPLQELGQATNEGGWVRGVELPWSIASNVSISDDGAHDANDDNWLYMSAVCYLYGLEIHNALGVPVPFDYLFSTAKIIGKVSRAFDPPSKTRAFHFSSSPP